jgi:hypothetical protein
VARRLISHAMVSRPAGPCRTTQGRAYSSDQLFSSWWAMAMAGGAKQPS